VNKNLTLSGIEASLLNGFHDAIIKRISIDYAFRKISLSISVLTGDPESQNRGGQRVLQRCGTHSK
jgi:hypothetical protein